MLNPSSFLTAELCILLLSGAGNKMFHACNFSFFFYFAVLALFNSCTESLIREFTKRWAMTLNVFWMYVNIDSCYLPVSDLSMETKYASSSSLHSETLAKEK